MKKILYLIPFSFATICLAQTPTLSKCQVTLAGDLVLGMVNSGNYYFANEDTGAKNEVVSQAKAIIASKKLSNPVTLKQIHTYQDFEKFLNKACGWGASASCTATIAVGGSGEVLNMLYLKQEQPPFKYPNVNLIQCSEASN